MSLADELQKLDQLRQSGAINDDEFALAKYKLLNHSPESATTPIVAPEAPEVNLESREQESRHWAMLLHLSVLAGYAVPFAGLVAPIIIWQWRKDDLPGIDAHGRNVMNWIISHIIYFMIAGILVLVFIGIPMIIGLAAVSVIFPIIAALKANNGEVWPYPMAIRFMR